MFFKNWIETEGTVASVEEISRRNGTEYSAVFTYKVDGHWCSGTFTTFSNTRTGDRVYLRYDPKDPERNDLSEKDTWTRWVIWGVIGIVAILVIVFNIL